MTEINGSEWLLNLSVFRAVGCHHVCVCVCVCVYVCIYTHTYVLATAL
jgi:hypothetical protein